MRSFGYVAVLLLFSLPCVAPAQILLGARLLGKAADAVAGDSGEGPDGTVIHTYDERDMLVYVPQRLPQAGLRALVVVLHGGGGSAERIVKGSAEKGLNMNQLAKKSGFIVAYLNGTAATRITSGLKVWNAGGGCCGRAFDKNVDDVAYISGAVSMLERKYGIDPARVYALGHSNGAIMLQRIMCEHGLFAAGVPVAGPLNIEVSSCPAAEGRQMLAIHGMDDTNAPVAGGKGSGISGVTFRSEKYSEALFNGSGGSYQLLLLPETDHNFEHIDESMEKLQGMSVAEKAARFFGLVQ